MGSQQIPPLRCGMTNKEGTTTTRMTNKSVANSKKERATTKREAASPLAAE
jgi:hypothetical protein